MDKGNLHATLTLVVRRFESGLVELAAGNIPSHAAQEELATLAALPMANLWARLRQLGNFDETMFTGRETSNTRSDGTKPLGRFYLAREKQFATMCLQLVDHCLDRAMRLLRNLDEHNHRDRMAPLVAWGKALHPQIGAVIAFEASRILRTAGHTSDAAELMASLSNNRETLSATLKHLYSIEPLNFLSHDIVAPKHRAICMTSIPEGKFLVGGFAPDLLHGGISLIDPDTNKSKLFYNNIVCSGLEYDSTSNTILATALRGQCCPGPHLAIIDMAGHIKHIVDLAPLVGANTLINFAKRGFGRFFVRNVLSKAIYELDNKFRIVKIHEGKQFQDSCDYTIINNNIAIMHSQKKTFDLFNTNTSQIVHTQKTVLHNTHKLIQDENKETTYICGTICVFEGYPQLKSRFLEVVEFNQDGIFKNHFAFYSGLCSDMIISRRNRESWLYFAADDRIVGFNIGGRDAA